MVLNPAVDPRVKPENHILGPILSLHDGILSPTLSFHGLTVESICKPVQNPVSRTKTAKTWRR